MITITKKEARLSILYLWAGFNILLTLLMFAMCKTINENHLNILSGMLVITGIAGIIFYQSLCDTEKVYEQSKRQPES